jgi:hypothetical protein
MRVYIVLARPRNGDVLSHVFLRDGLLREHLLHIDYLARTRRDAERMLDQILTHPAALASGQQFIIATWSFDEEEYEDRGGVLDWEQVHEMLEGYSLYDWDHLGHWRSPGPAFIDVVER